VRESVRADALALCHEDAATHRLGEQIGKIRSILQHLAHDVDTHVAAHRRRDIEHRTARGRHAVEPPHDHVGHSRRCRHCHALAVGARGRDEPRQLTNVERIAAGTLDHVGHLARRKRTAGHEIDETHRVVDAQRVERDRRRIRRHEP
jgi:hypothetical protein